MSEFFFAKITENIAEFDDHEIAHMKVMRIKIGSEILFTDGEGRLFCGNVFEKGKASVNETVETQEPQKVKVHLILSPIKWERMRFLVEKATELEVSTIVLLNMDRTTRKESESKIRKISLVVRDAIKQSGNFYMPKIMDAEKFEFPQNCENILFDRMGERSLTDLKNSKEFVLLFGPEGGFTEREKKRFESKGFTKVKLTDKTLRVETAVIAALSLIKI